MFYLYLDLGICFDYKIFYIWFFQESIISLGFDFVRICVCLM